MSSSLLPERPLLLSPSLAAAIGLNEALLLPVLCDCVMLGETTAQADSLWATVPYSKLLVLLPFWTLATVQTVSHSLAGKGIITCDTTVPQDQEQLRFAMDSSVLGALGRALTKPPPRRTAAASPKGASLLPAQWSPPDDMLELLMLKHQIPRTFALAQLEDFRLYWCDRGQANHSWSTKFHQHVLREWRRQESREARQDQEQPMSADWYPSEDALEILERDKINTAFIEDAVPEFILYWRQRGVTSRTWCSTFIEHIRRQWAKYTEAVTDSEPKAMSSDWQPSDDVFDILQLATIDSDFAQALMPEFVLFWKDAKTAHRSWNTKFLQHVKYHWALRHSPTAHHGANQNASQSGHYQQNKEAKGSLIQRLTDRSWAKGIVEEVE